MSNIVHLKSCGLKDFSVVTCDHVLSLYLCNLFSGGGHDTFLSQITCKKARIWTFFWLDRKQYGWFALFRLAKMPPSVSCCWFQSAFLLAQWAVNTHASSLWNFCGLSFLEFEGRLNRNFIHEIFSISSCDHVSRWARLAKIILQGTVQRGKSRGRQRNGWENNIFDLTGLRFCDTLKESENNVSWREAVILLASPEKKNKQKERWQGHRNSCGQLQRARFAESVAPQWSSWLRDRCKVQNFIINRIHFDTFEGEGISEGEGGGA